MSVCTILAVEDDADHAQLIRVVLQNGIEGSDVRVASDGAAARDYLDAAAGDNEDHPVPDLVILDLSLGDASGLEVLEWITGHDALGDIPVIIFSSTDDPEVASRAYALGARRYVVKPSNFRKLVDVVCEIVPRWADPGAFDDD